MNTERTQVGRRFWLWWMLASTVGLAVGGTVGAVGGAVGTFVWGAGSKNSEVGTVLIGVVIVAVSGAVIGASLGIAQRLVLRRQVSRPGRWILASTLGGAASFAIVVAMIVNLNLLDFGFLSVSLDSEFLAASALGTATVLGASLGIAQWLALRRKVSRSGWWVLASTAGPAVIYLVFFYVALFALDRIAGFSERTTVFQTLEDGKVIAEQVTTVHDHQRVVNGAVFFGVVGAVLGYGAITGSVVVRLFRQPEEGEPRAPNVLHEKPRFDLDMSNRTSLRSWLLAAAIFLIVLLAVYFLFQKIAPSPFRDLFLGNLLATIMGVVIGVPVALELTRRQQRAEDKAIAEERERRATERSTRYLKMIQFSMLTNTSFLQNVAANLRPGSVIYPNLDIEQLEATASLKYEIIDDLRLNGQLDVVRFNLRFIRRLLDLSLDFSYSHDRFALEPDVFLEEHKRIVDRVQREIPKALENINGAAAMIADKLEHDDVEVDPAGDRADVVN